MNIIKLLILIVIAMLLCPGLSAADVRIGVTGQPGVTVPQNVDEDLVRYLQWQSGEPLNMHRFENQQEMLTWVDRHQSIDMALFTEAFLAEQPRGRYLRLLVGDSAQQPLVWVSRSGVSLAKLGPVLDALQAMTGIDEGRQLLQSLGVSGWVAVNRLPEANTQPEAATDAVAIPVPAEKTAVRTVNVQQMTAGGFAPRSTIAVETPAVRPTPSIPKVAVQALRMKPEEPPATVSLKTAPLEFPVSVKVQKSDAGQQANSVPRKTAVEAKRDIKKQAAVAQVMHDPANAETDRGISLRQAEKIALENNLNLLAQAYNTRAIQTLVNRGYGIYDPLLSVELLDGQQKTQANSLVFAGTSKMDYLSLNTGISQKLPTGAELALGFNNSREKTTATVVPAVNPVHNSEVAFSVTQPLLQGFGKTVTEQEILLSVKDREASVQDLRNEAFLLLAEVRNSYYETLRTRDDLAFREASVRVAEQILKENQARVEVGVLPKVELLEAEVGLKSRQRELLDADRAYRNALDQLALLLNSDKPLQPTMTLEQPDVVLDEDAGYKSSLLYRPDLQRRLSELERLELEHTLGEDSLKPNLDLQARYGRQGIGDGFDNSISGLSNDSLYNWQLGIVFSYPLGNRTAKSDLQRTQVLQKGKQAELQQLKADIRTEIRLAIRQVTVARSKIEVSESEQALAKEKLDILLGRKDVGLATTRDVLEGEQDLASAQSGLVTALADYNKAVTEYLRVTGQLLAHEGVRFAGKIEPEADSSIFSLD